MSSNSEFLMERREYKYLLQPELVPYVRAAARTACRLDGYAGPEGTYRIRSLYLDTATNSLYRANFFDLTDRFKVRVRSYPSAAANAPVFLEVKRRLLDVNVKNRGMVPRSMWDEIIQDPGKIDWAALPDSSRGATERFLALVHTYALKPVMLVEYEREAYISEVDDYARLTFDLRIECQPKTTLDFDADPRAWHPVDHQSQTLTRSAVTLLEMKFAGAPPRWMVSLVRNLELQRYSFSKYGYSVSQHLEVPSSREASPALWRAA